MRKRVDYTEIFDKITSNQALLMKEYSEIDICIPETSKWDHAIPENYTNFQDGFLWPDYEAYRGAPLFDNPRYGRLYLRWEVPSYALEKNEAEKYLCFDRHGGKYTVTILKAGRMPEGNPSYFRFLPRVKKYTPKRRVKNNHIA